MQTALCLPVGRIFSGERPVLQDGYPVIGFVDESEGIYVAVMPPAVTCAATISRLVSAELTTGLTPEIPECFRPTRFFGT